MRTTRKDALLAAAEDRLKGQPFPVLTHSIMLADKARLNAFRLAISREVKDAMSVVDLGTGTGILASYAAECTSGRVVGVEVEESSVKIARKMIEASGQTNVEIVHGLSMKPVPSLRPDVLVGELLGPIGLEENTVEIFYDFVRRHPSVRKCIPADVRVYALPVTSVTLDAWRAEILDSFHSASTSRFDFRNIANDLEDELGRLVLTHRADVDPVGEPIELARFELGTARTSAFERELHFDASLAFGYLHLYFESTLTEGIVLSSAHTSPESHWEAHYVFRPGNADQATVSFSPTRRAFTVAWAPRRTS